LSYFREYYNIVCLAPGGGGGGGGPPPQTEKLHDFRMLKSRRMRCARHVARIGRRGKLVDYW
jgi:hypothetical protein